MNYNHTDNRYCIKLIILILSIAYQERSTSHIPHHSLGPICRSHTWSISSQFFFRKKSHTWAISSHVLKKNQIKNHRQKHELNEPEAGKPVADYQVEADHHQEEQQRGLKKSVQKY